MTRIRVADNDAEHIIVVGHLIGTEKACWYEAIWVIWAYVACPVLIPEGSEMCRSSKPRRARRRVLVVIRRVRRQRTVNRYDSGLLCVL
jgi:hypothetical protein